jgi:hypothetical protein
VLARDADFRRDFDALTEFAQAEDIGVMAIKSIARNNWRVGEPHRYHTWYEPLDQQAPIDAAIAFALGRPEITGVATAGDTRLLPLIIDAERRREADADQDLIDLDRIADAGSLFEHSPGRTVPDWLAHLMPS